MTTEVTHRLADDEQMPREGTLVGDRYEIKSVLGEGGFAAVYRALDTRTKTDVAVKVLDPLMSRRQEFSARFLREVETVSRLRHHNTIKIFDSGETENSCLYLVMELLTGEPLDEILEESKQLDPERVARITVQILKSLYEAHELGIIHRDLKPANVFIADLPGEKDYVKVLDFGIAKTIDDSQNSNLTATGQVMCSPDYVAPERVRDHVAYPSSDLYSLGIMMIELLDGELPYKGDSPMMVAMQHLRADDPVPMSPELENSPLGPVIRRACSKDLQERYTTAGEMLEDLMAVKFDGSWTPAAAPAAGAAPRAQASATAAAPIGSATVVDLDQNGAGAQQTAATAATSGELYAPQKKGPPVALIAVVALLLIAGAVAAALLLKGDASTDDAGQNGNAVAAATPTPQVEQEPAEEEPVAPIGPVSINTSPQGAALTVNGEELGTSPFLLSPGDIEEFPATLRVTLEGYEPWETAINSVEDLRDGISIPRLTEIEEPVADSGQENGGGLTAAERRRLLEQQRRAEEAAAAAAANQDAAAAAAAAAAAQRAEQERIAAEQRAAEQRAAEAAAAAAAQQQATPDPPEDNSGPSRVIDLAPRR